MSNGKKKSSVAEIYQIKVRLLRTKPPIWRRLRVPAHLTLANLHDVLQSAMGWDNCHLHEFRVGGETYGQPDQLDDVSDERKIRLHQALGQVGAKAVYTYDFGDGWEHAVLLEKRLTSDPGVVYPMCAGGRGACPPEDCGGIGGFYELVDALQDPDPERREEMLDWAGEYDPEVFSVEVAPLWSSAALYIFSDLANRKKPKRIKDADERG